MILGCAGGNGLDQVDPEITRQVLAIDINPSYVEETRNRYQGELPGLQVLELDIQAAELPAVTVEFVHAGLVLEYVDVHRVVPKIARVLVAGGTLHAVLQLPSDDAPSVSPSGFASLQRLTSALHLVPPEELTAVAAAVDLHLIEQSLVRSSAGKKFAVLMFQRS